ncbi:MAG: site-2 protease family protein [Alkalinema sp. FL-bin-369]|nr:site-2 protease family protein [Leptolyngbyaceae cyanobacterium LF-bin-369]
MFFETLFKDPIYFFSLVAILIISIVIHELAHGIAALSQGDDTPRQEGHMTLNPVVHMGYESLIFLCVAGIAWGSMPVSPHKFRHPRWSDILVSAAGPLSNLVLGTLCITAIIATQQSALPMVSQEFLSMAARINMLLFLFNLLPIPPLDGFNVCEKLFPALKLDRFRNSPFALFFMMALFVLPVTGIVLSSGSMFMMSTVTRLIGPLFRL